MNQTRNRLIKKIKFSVPTVYDIQHDSYNCGIYVVHYINSVIRNKSGSVFIPNDYRESLRVETWKFISDEKLLGYNSNGRFHRKFDPSEIFQYEFDCCYLFHLMPLLMSEWKAVVDRNEYQYIYMITTLIHFLKNLKLIVILLKRRLYIQLNHLYCIL